MRRIIALVVTGVLATALTACGVSIPTDPYGTLDRVRGGTLVVGATANEEWVQLDGDVPTGSEPELVEQFAERLDAQVEWVTGSEQELIDRLERGEIDMAVGGFANDTPWSEKAAMTAAYVDETDEHGESVKHVMLTRMGENAFLLELEKFLAEHA